MVEKLGRCSGQCCQHWVMIRYLRNTKHQYQVNSMLQKLVNLHNKDAWLVKRGLNEKCCSGEWLKSCRNSVRPVDPESCLHWTSCLYSHRARTVLRRIHPASAGDKLQNLLVGFAGVRHVTQREDLPQQYSKWPAGGGARSRTELTRSHGSSCAIY